MRHRNVRDAGLLLLCIVCSPWLGIALASGTAPPGKVFRDCRGVCPEMVVVGPGSYLMGSPADDTHQGKDGEEQPQHRVNIAYSFAVADMRSLAMSTRLSSTMLGSPIRTAATSMSPPDGRPLRGAIGTTPASLKQDATPSYVSAGPKPKRTHVG